MKSWFKDFIEYISRRFNALLSFLKPFKRCCWRMPKTKMCRYLTDNPWVKKELTVETWSYSELKENIIYKAASEANK